jgi:hypothetical protein
MQRPAAELKSLHVGFHVANAAGDVDCGRRVTWHDSPRLSWLQCECGASSLDGVTVCYGAPVPADPPPRK